MTPPTSRPLPSPLRLQGAALLAAAWAAIAPGATAADPVPLGPPFVATSATSGIQKQPWLAGNQHGDLVLVWSQGEVFGRLFDRNGNPKGPDFLLNPNTPSGLQDEPYVAMDPWNGDFVACWSDRHGNDGDSMGSAARFFAADGTPRGPEFFLNSHTAFSQFEPYAAFSPLGEVFCVWADAGTDGVCGVIGRVYDRLGYPLTAEFLVNEPHWTSQIDPSVAADWRGNFVVAYVDASGQTGEPREILARRFGPLGQPLGPPFPVNTIPAGMQREPFVAMDPLGDFVVAFHDESGNDGAGFGVYARAFHADGTPKGPQFQVNATTAGDQKDPHVAVDYVGNVVITWTHLAGGDADVRARRFDPDGQPLGGEFPVHDPAAGAQQEPRFTMTQSGERLAASWFGADGHAYLRLFDDPRVTPSGPALRGTTVGLSLDFPGAGGQTYLLLAALSQADVVAVPIGRAFPLAPDPLFFATLAFPESGIFGGLAGTVAADGHAAAAFHVPNDPALHGIAVSFAGVTLNPASPGGVDHVTTAIELVLR